MNSGITFFSCNMRFQVDWSRCEDNYLTYRKCKRNVQRLVDLNKAGYTAISCERVGRGGNARFPTFQLERDGPTNRPTDQPTDRRTDKASYRVACPQLKMNIFHLCVRRWRWWCWSRLRQCHWSPDCLLSFQYLDLPKRRKEKARERKRNQNVQRK